MLCSVLARIESTLPNSTLPPTAPSGKRHGTCYDVHQEPTASRSQRTSAMGVGNEDLPSEPSGSSSCSGIQTGSVLNDSYWRRGHQLGGVCHICLCTAPRIEAYTSTEAYTRLAVRRHRSSLPGTYEVEKGPVEASNNSVNIGA